MKSELRRAELISHLRSEDSSVAVVELASRFNVTVRTVLRDVEQLRLLGHQIVGTRGRGGGLVLEDGGAKTSKDERTPGGASRQVRQPVSKTQPVFVGRASELNDLEQLFEEVKSGRGQVAMIAGEPGIGKSTVAELVGKRLSAKRAQVYWGRCPESEGALSYWPWTQIIRAYARTHSPTDLKEQMGPGAADLAEIAPELRSWIPGLERPAAVSSPESARFRLFTSVTGFLANASARQPIVLLMEDLHWADRSTLLLLEFAAQELAESRVMIVGTYRDVELGRGHPLSLTLGELNRGPRFHRLTLRGLDRQELSELLALVYSKQPRSELVDLLYRHTEGNPFFVCETVRLLLEEAPVNAGQQDLEWLLNARVPVGIREAIGRRLDRISAGANRLLRIASVLGREMAMPELLRLANLVPAVSTGDGDILRLLDEGIDAGVLDRSGRGAATYQFTHSLIRDTLYQELTTAERVRLHQMAGEALEDVYASAISPHLPRLAHHFLEAAPGGQAPKAVKYAEMAGRHASDMIAYEDASRYLRSAIDALSLVERPDERKRCELTIDLGRAQFFAGELLESRATQADAAEIALKSGFHDLLAEAAIEYEAAGWQPGLEGRTAVRLLQLAIDQLGARESRLKARAIAALGRALAYDGQHDRGLEVARSAIDMARRVGDPETIATTLWCRLPIRADVTGIEERVEAAREAMRICREIGQPDLAVQAQTWLINDACDLGDAVTLERELQSWWANGVMVRNTVYLYAAATTRSWVATRDGLFPEAERLAVQAFRIGRNLKGLDAHGVYGSQMFSIRKEQGRLEEVKPALESFLSLGMPAWRPGLALTYAELDLRPEAEGEFEQLAADGFDSLARDSKFAPVLSYLAEVCCYLEDRENASTLYALLKPFEGIHINFGVAMAYYGPAEKYLGMLASLLGRWEDSERHFANALSQADRMRSPPQGAHVHYWHGRMLLKRGSPGDVTRAYEHLNRARATALDLGMQSLAAKADHALRTVRSTSLRKGYPAGLSEREVEVLRVLAGGFSNRDIAEQLFITPNTVASHIKSILNKTGASNRTEAALFATRNGVV